MKQVHFVQSLETDRGGGLGKAALDLHNHAIRNGQSSKLFTTHRSIESIYQSTCIVAKRIADNPFFYAPSLKGPAEDSVCSAEVVHGHGLYVYTNYLFGRLTKKYSVPMVYHPHGFLEPWILNRSRLKKGIVKHLFEDENIKNVKLWRALTEKEARQIRDIGVTSPIVIAPNGIDIQEIDAYLKQGAPSRLPKTALFLGRIHPKKGLELLVEAWARIIGKYDDWDLVIAGPDEVGYRKFLEGLVLRLGAKDRITFMGETIGQEKYRLISSSSVFVLPSYSEGFSIAILEAMACHVPVVASTACNFPELASAGGGWICEPSLVSLERTLHEVLASPETELRERGYAGRRLIEGSYTWTSVHQTIEQACQEHLT